MKKGKEKVKKEDIRYDEENSEIKKKNWMVNEARTTGYYAEPIYPYFDNQNFAESQNTTENEETEYEKYQNLPEGTHAEFIDGKIYYLDSPNTKHQRTSRRLMSRFDIYLQGKTCEAFQAPFDVKIDFEFDKSSETTLQPDILIICDDEKLDEKGVFGAPDLVIEILSPSNPDHDKVKKFEKYLLAGVKEYWIVDPIREEINVYLLDYGRYEETTYVKGDVIKVSILDNLHIDVTDLFEGYIGVEIPEVKAARKEEREKAIEMEKLAREEEREKAVEMEMLAREEERKEMAKRLLDTGGSIEQAARITGLALEVIQQLESDTIISEV